MRLRLSWILRRDAAVPAVVLGIIEEAPQSVTGVTRAHGSSLVAVQAR